MKLQIANLEDPEILREINNSAIPDVNQLTEQKARWLVEHSLLARVASIDEKAAGVIIVLSDTAELNSEYFRWFSVRYGNFLYIDRVIVAAWARRLGVATTLYLEVDHTAQAHGVAAASDVYCDPPNTASLNFHKKMGYLEIGRQASGAEGKIVSKLMKYGEKAERKSH